MALRDDTIGATSHEIRLSVVGAVSVECSLGEMTCMKMIGNSSSNTERNDESGFFLRVLG